MKNRKLFYAFFLFCLFVSKVGAFHGFTHDDSLDNKVEHCDFCHLATKNDTGDFLLVQNNIVINPIVYISGTNQIEYATDYRFTANPIKLFSRPPPAFIL
ncbi:hypothetical protein GH721_02030 [Kriegella sp. EG-1]|nr:hypothetical protein [Flavobacteriaceae bacterium EG-1]